MTLPNEINPLLISTTGGYQIERSLRFNSTDSAYLNKNFGTPTDNLKWTWSGWVKRSALGAYQVLFIGDDGTSNNFCYLRFSDVDKLECYQLVGGSYNLRLETSGVFRDPSAWYHIVLIYDSANATSTDRVQIYVNGNRQTVSYVVGPFSQNTASQLNVNGRAHAIGRLLYSNIHYLNGYLTEINFIDGSALSPSSFGETDAITGVWKPKKYAGTYSGNSFYLKFADNSNTTAATLGKDSSGLGNNWTPSGFSVSSGAGNDSLIDTPTPYTDGGNGRGNYCVLSPLGNGSSSAATSGLSNGNLQVSGSITGGFSGSIGIPVGKWYWEVTLETVATPFVGVCNDSRNVAADPGVTLSNEYGFYFNPTINYMDGTTNPWSTGSVANGDIIGVAVDASDLSNIKLWLSKNNTWYSSSGGTSGNPAGGTNQIQTITDGKILYPYCAIRNAGSPSTMHANFGQRSFSYTPPSGFLALNTQNLPEPTIKKPSSYFNVELWSGSGATNARTGLGFSPDLVWVKARGTNANSHYWYDAVRGVTKYLNSDATGAEGTEVGGQMTSFDSNGFTVATNDSHINKSGNTYVAWCWDESATPGFDIVTYTGTGSNTDINHNLGVTPSFAIIKQRNTTQSWWVWHTALGNNVNANNTMLELNGSAGTYTADDVFRGFTSSVFKVGTDTGSNTNGGTYVAYLWSEVASFSKFGSYAGNSSTDGVFIHCGFKPRFILIKNTGFIAGYGDWYIFDTSRNTYNASNYLLWPNLSNAESGANTAFNVDILSNGFKLRTAYNDLNAGYTYIFAAWAESPFKYSLAR